MQPEISLGYIQKNYMEAFNFLLARKRRQVNQLVYTALRGQRGTLTDRVNLGLIHALLSSDADVRIY